MIIAISKKSSRAFQSKFEIAQLNKILCDIYLQKMNLNFVSGDSTIKVNLANKKNGEVCDVYASHNHHYSLTYFIYTNTDTIKLYTGFTDSGGILICSPKGNGPENLKNLLDWMYMYKIATLTASNHKTIRHFYNHNNLSRIIKWAK